MLENRYRSFFPLSVTNVNRSFASPLVSFHYTPTHASWVNLIECFFNILTRQGLQQAVHQSGQELEHFLKSFIQEYNKRCGPFEWTKGSEKLRRIIELTEQWQSQ